MELAQRPPTLALAPHIRSLAGWLERADGPVARRELPGARIVLVVSFGPTLDVDGRTFGSFVAGLHGAPALTEHAGLGHGVQAYLTPLGARRLLGVPMRELTGRVVELEDLVGVRVAAELGERLYAAGSWPARLGLLERAIAERVAAAPPLAPELDHVWRRLERTRGTVPAATLAAEVGWSRRHLAATLREHAGLPPKSLARILRFEHAAARLRQPGDAPLADLALDCGFYDQAHLNRDFRAFAGMTPAQYREVTSVQDAVAAAA